MKYVIGFIIFLLILFLLFGPTPLEWVKTGIGALIKLLKLTKFKGILM